MYFHPIRKSIGLLILYSIIIVGIFFLQFRNESVISQNFGALRIALAQTQDKDGGTSLKNSMQVSFKGISFTADEVHPAILTKKSEGNNTVTENLSLLSYEQQTQGTVTFKFRTEGEDEVSLTFAHNESDDEASLSIFASLPKDAESVSFSFKPSTGYSVTERTNSRQIFTSKNSTYSFSASKLTDEQIFISQKSPFATFSLYDPSTIFTFASLSPTLEVAGEQLYQEKMCEFRAKLVSGTAEAMKMPSQLTESIVVAYMAEMDAQGRFEEALASVPESFKKGNKRTYLSAPYFGSLSTMQPSLSMKLRNMEEMIENAAGLTSLSSSALNIFTMEDLAEFIEVIGPTESVKKLLSIPSAIMSGNATNADGTEFKATVAQAAGIIRTYIALSKKNSQLAEYLAPAMESCVSAIESSCSLAADATVPGGQAILLAENDAPVPPVTAIEAGAALISYGEQVTSSEITTAGRAITSSALIRGGFDLATAADIYPSVVSNVDYPHCSLILRDGSIWAWTVADISYTQRNNVGTMLLKSDVGNIHYTILMNMPEFKNMNIYGLSYPSDPRFENYNSAGYVYRKQLKTLFLKMRNKNETETVRFTF